MTALAEQAIMSAMQRAKGKKLELDGATEREREATVEYMRLALDAGWSWTRIGQGLGISATGARRYYNRNHRRVRSV